VRARKHKIEAYIFILGAGGLFALVAPLLTLCNNIITGKKN
jgi:hypothetical protein